MATLGGLSEEQIRRYSRQILLPEVGGRGQRRLLGAHARLHADGTLGEVAALYLAAAGVGAITWANDVPAAVRECVAAINPDCRLGVGEPTTAPDVELELGETASGDRSTGSAPRIVITWHGRVARLQRLLPGRSACPLCLPPPEGEPAPPGPAAHAALGSLAAVEALNALLGIGEPLIDRVLELDLPTCRVETRAVIRRPDCPQCGAPS